MIKDKLGIGSNPHMRSRSFGGHPEKHRERLVYIYRCHKYKKIESVTTVPSLYNTHHYNMDLDVSWMSYSYQTLLP